jgi:hypothetical protein
MLVSLWCFYMFIYFGFNYTLEALGGEIHIFMLITGIIEFVACLASRSINVIY